MKMTDLIDAVVARTGMGRAEAGTAVEAMLDALPRSRRRGGIELGGPGTAEKAGPARSTWAWTNSPWRRSIVIPAAWWIVGSRFRRRRAGAWHGPMR